jgi:hypothetical protein
MTSEAKGAWDEVGYLAWKIGVTRKEAFVTYLKEAGVWREPPKGTELEPEPLPPIPGEFEEQTKNAPGAVNLPVGDAPAGETSAPAPAVTPGAGKGETEAAGTLKSPPPKLPAGSGKGVEALREFYESLELREEDADLIWRKRGIPRSGCEAFGFKSSSKGNEKIIKGLLGKYSQEDLASAGLWKMEGKTGRPQPQLCGYGNTGEKDKHKDLIWGYVNPILIPYFDKDGEVIALRPHKGNIPGEKARLFVAGFKKGWGAERIKGSQPHKVVTEGEFKACAIYWAFDGKVGAAAIPGIQQSKNYAVMEELKSWLWGDGRAVPKKIVVGFDNEEKGDPRLPGFKPDRRKRFEAVVWARYLAYMLKKEFGRALVARLPDGWRDANGKADWDGRMAALAAAAVKK